MRLEEEEDRIQQVKLFPSSVSLASTSAAAQSCVAAAVVENFELEPRMLLLARDFPAAVASAAVPP